MTASFIVPAMSSVLAMGLSGLCMFVSMIRCKFRNMDKRTNVVILAVWKQARGIAVPWVLRSQRKTGTAVKTAPASLIREVLYFPYSAGTGTNEVRPAGSRIGGRSAMGVGTRPSARASADGGNALAQ